MARKIKVRGVPKDPIDHEQLALVYWLQAKRVQRERREREAKARGQQKGGRDER